MDVVTGELTFSEVHVPSCSIVTCDPSQNVPNSVFKLGSFHTVNKSKKELFSKVGIK